MAFEYDKILVDVSDWFQWMKRTEGDGVRSWKTWWADEYGYLANLLPSQRVALCALSSRFLLVGIGLIYQKHTSSLEVALCITFVVCFATIYSLVRAEFCEGYHCLQRGLKAIWLGLAISIPLILLISFQVPVVAIFRSAQTLLGLGYILGFLVSVGLTLNFKWSILVNLSKLYDYILGFILLAPVFLLSIIYVPSIIQTRLMFNNAFSKGVIIDDMLRGKQQRASSAPSESSVSINIESMQKIISEQSQLIQKQKELIESFAGAASRRASERRSSNGNSSGGRRPLPTIPSGDSPALQGRPAPLARSLSLQDMDLSSTSVPAPLSSSPNDDASPLSSPDSSPVSLNSSPLSDAIKLYPESK
eukprot:TRINITY_DN1164_c0_g1_i10.p1 TRINITY_DN1164_c0_g1~~TRINITY_DN1164_c0_g1_i10.p1  ORF type:complete len:386 (+),score=103.94 TRINITY_DN1164_c0_g1_i10:74-1159(+)